MLLGKTIVVTGISSGIGARVGELAVALGADIIGVDINEPARPLDAFIKADIGSAQGVAEIVETLPRRFDALCNVAGVSGMIGAAKTLAINFYGLAGIERSRRAAAARGRRRRQCRLDRGLRLARQSGARQGVRRRARISGPRPAPRRAQGSGHGGLSAVEGALALVDDAGGASALFKDRGVRVNAVSPGPVTTPILKEFRQIFGDPRVDDDIARVGRAGSAPDIAPAALFLCSDGARWINGANLPVDGGLEASINASVLGF